MRKLFVTFTLAIAVALSLVGASSTQTAHAASAVHKGHTGVTPQVIMCTNTISKGVASSSYNFATDNYGDSIYYVTTLDWLVDANSQNYYCGQSRVEMWEQCYQSMACPATSPFVAIAGYQPGSNGATSNALCSMCSYTTYGGWVSAPSSGLTGTGTVNTGKTSETVTD